MSNSTAAFAESSTLDVLVPEDSNFNIEEALNSADDTIESREFTLLPSVAQRNVLFFGEFELPLKVPSILLILGKSQMN